MNIAAFCWLFFVGHTRNGNRKGPLFTELDVNTHERSREFTGSFLTREFVSIFRCCFCLAASVFSCPSIILLTSCSITRLVTRKASIRRMESLKKRPHCCQINLPRRIKSDSGLLSHDLRGFKNDVQSIREMAKVPPYFVFCSY